MVLQGELESCNSICPILELTRIRLINIHCCNSRYDFILEWAALGGAKIFYLQKIIFSHEGMKYLETFRKKHEHVQLENSFTSMILKDLESFCLIQFGICSFEFINSKLNCLKLNESITNGFIEIERTLPQLLGIPQVYALSTFFRGIILHRILDYTDCQ